ncbi:MAG: hypothetical protein EXS13_15325, partial [Planctomycetes bacterium]|nr:hypothetical protein [Planctomycetota bacterium]
MNYFFVNSDANSLRDPPRPRYPILLERGFFAAGGDRAKYGEQLRVLDSGDVVLLYENGVGVVAVGTVLEPWDGVSHPSPLYYTASELRGFDSSASAEFRVAVDWFLDLSAAPIGVATLVERLGYNPRKVIHRIVAKRPAIASLIEEYRDATALVLEITSTTPLNEGAPENRTTVAYERSRAAVALCKAHFGTACVICGIDFGGRYGVEFA